MDHDTHPVGQQLGEREVRARLHGEPMQQEQRGPFAD
jgi:hypothetical protein